MTSTPTTPIEIGHVIDDTGNLAVVYIDDEHVEIPIYLPKDDAERDEDGKILPLLVPGLSLEDARGLANLLDHALMHIDDPEKRPCA